MFTDTHCHFEPQYFDNYKSIIEKAYSNGINRLIASGCSMVGNEESIKLSNEFDNIYSTIGYHPDQAEIIGEEEMDVLENQIINNKDKVIGIGEIGLDYHYDGYNKENQIKLFRKQLELAVKYNLPVVIHSRDAVQDTIDVLKDYKLKGVIHSFSGSFEVAKIYIGMGFKLGINGVVTFKNCSLKDVLVKIEPSNIVLETDSPYLSPEPVRGTKNDSSNIIYIAQFIADLYNITLEKLSEITNKSISEIFDI